LAVYFAETGLEVARDRDEVVMPSVHHALSGAIQFEWHRKDFDLEISVLPSGRIAAYVEHQGEATEVDLTTGMSVVEPELREVLTR
jgi:hypothetical protein